ncbi:MAG TPA: hypothetical protein GXX18_05350 [Bacillales bacterium]|nr:hypothetical protein [Bacillales bacterium]
MSSWDSTWKSFAIYHSSINVQRYLLHSYQNNNVDDSEKKSFENCYPFIYYLDHGKSYYELSKQAPLSIKPILLFYGMVQLLKACLLTVDPEYPESATVLAHGVTTRKRKKRNYDFLKDEVKTQKNGLFSHVAVKMFHVKHHLDAEKFTMDFLLGRIPELNHLFQVSLRKQQNYKIAGLHDQTFIIPACILDDLHMTVDRFDSFLKELLSFDFQMVNKASTGSKQLELIELQVNCPINSNDYSPLQFDYFENTLHIPTAKEQFMIFPEILTHYLLLYNLSMISRYETEWWSELLHSFDSLDYPFIEQFLSVTTVKVPYLINQYLLEKQKFK